MGWSKKFLTDAKFRVSWGITGQQEIGDFDALNQLVFGNYFYNGLSGVQTSSRLGNPNLKWEEQEQTDFGLDLNLFNGRISFTGDYYIKNTRDLLNDRQLPAEIGFTDNARVNLGSIQNKGIELEVSAYPFRKSSFSWQTSVNWTRNRNKITDLPGGDYIYQNLWYVGEGKEPGQFFGYKHLGIYEYDESNAYTDDYKIRLIPQIKKDADGNVVLDKDLKPTVLGYTYPNGTPYAGTPNKIKNNGAVAKGGDVIWENLPAEDGTLNGEISIEDRQILGSGLPKWTIGFNNTFNYDLARNNAQLSSSNVTPFPNWINDSWKYPGQITEVYSRDRATDNMRTNGSYFLEDGSFIRLQSVRLGYQVPPKLSKKALMRNLNVYLYSNNLATWTAYSGFDPEVEQQRVLAPGRDTGKYPRRREIGFGLSSSF
jgi:outer membrane receptor protein involved in Fe transport